MEKTKEKTWKSLLDNFLIYNLYLLILGSIFLGIGYFQSIKGNSSLFNLFQKLWYPVFIPSLSVFFTAILIEVILSKLISRKSK
tara:strand:- start:1426 stop:1677 length:252 start_codon:yes stop_codon:yes gene_type:complete